MSLPDLGKPLYDRPAVPEMTGVELKSLQERNDRRVEAVKRHGLVPNFDVIRLECLLLALVTPEQYHRAMADFHTRIEEQLDRVQSEIRRQQLTQGVGQ